MQSLANAYKGKVYHGTVNIYRDSLTNGIRLDLCNNNVDFGRGFYTTTNYAQAEAFAIKKAKLYNIKQIKKQECNSNWYLKFASPMILVYNIEEDIFEQLIGHTFDKPDDMWAEFIFNNRLGHEYLKSEFHNLNAQYDYVYGCMADAAIATLMEDFENGIITYEQFCSAVTPYDEDNQDQLSFHTENGLTCLKLGDIVILESDKRRWLA